MPSQGLEDFHEYVRDNILDSLQVVKEVECYRNSWKPRRVKILLFAESHVHTSDNDFGRVWRYKKLKGHFVRYVYCLGSGENELFKKPPSNNAGTRQFWEIFFSCMHQVKSNSDFRPVKSSGQGWERRIENKIGLLRSLCEAGVWLVDASPVAINMLGDKKKIEMMKVAWELYTGKLLTKLANNDLKRVGIIGKTVEKAVGGEIKALGLPCEVFNQPGYHMTEDQRWALFLDYYEFCHGHGSG